MLREDLHKDCKTNVCDPNTRVTVTHFARLGYNYELFCPDVAQGVWMLFLYMCVQRTFWLAAVGKRIHWTLNFLNNGCKGNI